MALVNDVMGNLLADLFGSVHELKILGWFVSLIIYVIFDFCVMDCMIKMISMQHAVLYNMIYKSDSTESFYFGVSKFQS